MNISNTHKILLFLLVALSFNGCISQAFSVGSEKSYCQENGCDYTDVGLCANPLEILENKSDLSEIRKRNEDAK
ncbi:MAG: hypothetical protein WC656_01855 [Sulfurimonas sp.]|jgi:hypothetical protein